MSGWATGAYVPISQLLCQSSSKPRDIEHAQIFTTRSPLPLANSPFPERLPTGLKATSVTTKVGDEHKRGKYGGRLTGVPVALDRNLGEVGYRIDDVYAKICGTRNDPGPVRRYIHRKHVPLPIFISKVGLKGIGSLLVPRIPKGSYSLCCRFVHEGRSQGPNI